MCSCFWFGSMYKITHQSVFGTTGAFVGFLRHSYLSTWISFTTIPSLIRGPFFSVGNSGPCQTLLLLRWCTGRVEIGMNLSEDGSARGWTRPRIDLPEEWVESNKILCSHRYSGSRRNGRTGKESFYIHSRVPRVQKGKWNFEKPGS